MPMVYCAVIPGPENAIADRREFYNESVNINNVHTGIFVGAGGFAVVLS